MPNETAKPDGGENSSQQTPTGVPTASAPPTASQSQTVAEPAPVASQKATPAAVSPIQQQSVLQPAAGQQPSVQAPSAPASLPQTPPHPPVQQPQSMPVATRPVMPAMIPQGVPTPAVRTTGGQIAPPARPGMPLQPGQRPVGVQRKPPNPKRLMYGCAGCSGGGVLFFVILVLIFVGQTTTTGENPLARSLGMDTGTFINTLILLVNLIFGALTVVLFILATVGMFRFFMARKDDKPARKKGVTQAGIAGLLLFFIVFIWVGIYLFLSSKKVPVLEGPVSAIVTEPVQTIGLTAPINIKFDASNVPISERQFEILSYAWDFRDGGTATVVAPSHEFTTIGRYDVQLEITKRSIQTAEESVDTFTHTVVVANVELSASFTATPSSGSAPLAVAFDASGALAPAGEITSYEWDFNNDNNFTDATGVTAKHEFTQIGTYKVNLRVTDNTGQFKVGTQEIRIEGPNVPVAAIDIPTTTGKYFVGQQYSFSAEKSTSPNGKIQKYSWDFGDGTTGANTRSATHVYKTAGTYEVILKVTDETNTTGEGSMKIKLETPESAPIGAIKTVPAPAGNDSFITGTVPFEVVFDGSSSTDNDNNIVDFKWDYDGDGINDDSGEKVTYVYKKEGTYNAVLTVVDAENNESRATLVVKAGAQPLQALVVAEPVEGVIPLTVTFDASSSSYPGGQIVSYEWDFGDGSPKRIDTSKVTYKYTKIGTFNASVTVIASDNSRASTQTPVNVRPVPLTSCFSITPESGSAPLDVDFDPGCSSGTVAKFSWDFGDGQTSKIRKPSHSYGSPGSYQVTLEVADNQNVIDTYTKNLLVTGTL